MEVNIIGEALKFMLLGMGVVFIFLYIMVLVIKAQAYIIEKYFPDKVPAIPTSSIKDNDEKTRVAAVIAAVTEFRKNKS